MNDINFSNITPHGGDLRDLLVGDKRKKELEQKARALPSITLENRTLHDLELLLVGGFSPLRGFMQEDDYTQVLDQMRLADGTLWPMPITLDIDQEKRNEIAEHDHVALRSATGLLLGVMEVSDIWQPDKEAEARAVFGTTDTSHSGVYYLLEEMDEYYVGGDIQGVALPPHFDFQELRHTPQEVRTMLAQKEAKNVVGFQTRNPMHRAHKELTDRAIANIDGHLLLHPVVGMTKPGDINHYTRVQCYKRLLSEYPEDRAILSLLPLAMRMGGPREALWHAIIRKNYGCTHFIVGRDHSGTENSEGEDFYDPYAAQEFVEKHSEELGIDLVPFKWMVYVPQLDSYEPIDAVEEEHDSMSISGTEFRKRLREGKDIPEWFSYPKVVEELRHVHPKKQEQGFTVFFTGLSGSGKSTLAEGLAARLREVGGRRVTVFDGDVVRRHLNPELGFSKEDRSRNVRRIGYVASEVTRHGGTAICAPIAPYREDREANRRLIEQTGGGYFEVFVDAPIEVCEKRDVKGLYAKARAGEIENFTGIDDPYEKPTDPDIVCKTAEESIEESLHRILSRLVAAGYLPEDVIA